VKSVPAPVQVFPPLRIEPRNITLLIGAAFQVLTSGGPADATVEFFLRYNLYLLYWMLRFVSIWPM
jgi:hypothetical protein